MTKVTNDNVKILNKVLKDSIYNEKKKSIKKKIFRVDSLGTKFSSFSFVKFTDASITNKYSPLLTHRKGLIGVFARFLMDKINIVIKATLKKPLETQQLFNHEVIHNITSIKGKMDFYEQQIKEQIRELQKSISGNKETIEELQKSTSGNKETIEELQKSTSGNKETIEELQTFTEYKPQELELRKNLSEIPEINYLAFENHFRGSEEVIRERQAPYLRYFTDCKKVLDIGCGRGEFLELARDHNILAEGIDIDEDMFVHCRNKGLKVTHGNIFPFLLDMEDDYLDGVFSSQVIEHIDFVKLQNLLYLLQKKVKKGGRIVLETINPHCLSALQNFHTDLTHIKPIFPDVLTFIGESFSLKRVDIIFRIPIKEGLEDPTFTGEHLYEYMDYAVVLEK